MNDRYSVTPKVVSLNSDVKVSITGLQARTINPGSNYNVRILSMNDHFDSLQIKVPGLPPEDKSPIHELSRGGKIQFNHRFNTRGEYRIIISSDSDPPIYLTTEHIYALSPDMARLKPYKGDLHIHTYYSDGRMSPIYTAVTGKRLGLDFAAITDHGQYNPSLEAIDMAKAIDMDMLLLPGEEISFPSGHIVSICASAWITEMINDRNNYDRELKEVIEERLKDRKMIGNLTKERYAPAKWVIDKIHQFNGYAFLAHPHWVSGDRYHLDQPIFEQLLEDGEIDGVEVIGGYYPSELEANQLTAAKYYWEVAKGRKIPILGNSDTHFRPRDDIYGWYWTMVLAESLCQEDIFHGIANLKSVACERPNGERLMVCGPYELVEYAHFLEREFFPVHDRLCAMEGEIYMDMLMGKEASSDELSRLKKELKSLYSLWYPQ